MVGKEVTLWGSEEVDKLTEVWLERYTCAAQETSGVRRYGEAAELLLDEDEEDRRSDAPGDPEAVDPRQPPPMTCIHM